MKQLRSGLLICLALVLCSIGAAGAQTQQDGSVAVATGTQGLPPLPPGAEQLPDVVATIDGQPIAKRELLAQAQTMRIQAMQAGARDPGQADDFLPFVLDALIGERLVYTDAQKRGVGATDAEVDERVKAVIEGYGGQEAFETAMQQQGLDLDYIRLQIKQDLTIDKIIEVEVKPGVQIAEEAIKEYYDRYQDQMRVPAYYKLRHIMKQVPESEGADARAAAEQQLKILKQQLVEGADFAELALKHSDDARTREDGGEMPWIVLTGREDSFEPAVAALEVDQLSDVVATRVGLHLIQLMDRKPERVRTLDEARAEITNILAAYEARRQIQSRVDSLRSTSKVEILM